MVPVPEPDSDVPALPHYGARFAPHPEEYGGIEHGGLPVTYCTLYLIDHHCRSSRPPPLPSVSAAAQAFPHTASAVAVSTDAERPAISCPAPSMNLDGPSKAARGSHQGNH